MQPTDTSTLPQLAYAELPMSLNRGDGWAAARDRGPVLYGDGWYYLTKREDVLDALRNPAVFSSQRAFDDMISPVPMVPLAFDPPEHTRFRRILHPFFGVGALAPILPSLQRQAADIIDTIAVLDECEVMSELATPYPSGVFLTLFGLPLEDRDTLIEWKDAIIAMGLETDPDNVDLTPAVKLFEYVTDAVTTQRNAPRDGILCRILESEDSLTDTEAIGMFFVFILAGLDTVTSAIGTALLELARRPDVRDRLCENPEEIAVFVEEMLRLEPPAPVLGRVCTQPVTVSGVTLPAGAQVRLCVGAINRDGSDATSVDEVVMDGKIHRHWGFGGGAHRCLGAHLARMELNLIITEWLRRIPDFELVPGHEPAITWPAATATLPTLRLRILRSKLVDAHPGVDLELQPGDETRFI